VSRRKKSASKLKKAKAIVSSMTSHGAAASHNVHAAVRRAGISTRTYRTARKQLGTKAIRTSRKGGGRGRGRWFAKRG
jgi:hypothetical protein